MSGCFKLWIHLHTKDSLSVWHDSGLNIRQLQMVSNAKVKKKSDLTYRDTPLVHPLQIQGDICKHNELASYNTLRFWHISSAILESRIHLYLEMKKTFKIQKRDVIPRVHLESFTLAIRYKAYGVRVGSKVREEKSAWVIEVIQWPYMGWECKKELR